MTNDSPVHEGMRVLVVEDDYLSALWLKRVLSGRGWEVVGPASTVDEAVRLISEEAVDVAVLDINLRGRSSAGVADALKEKETPFFFVSGYGSPSMLPQHHRFRRRLTKPVSEEEIVGAMEAVMGG